MLITGRFFNGCWFASTASKRLYSSAQVNYYQVLELPVTASIREIKSQFKRLSKKYHPDLNAHLSEEKRQANSKKYVEMVSAYDTLKDSKRKKEYDLTLSSSAFGASASHSRRHDSTSWDNEYYEGARNYSRGRASGSYASRSYNFRRNRVHHFNRDGYPDSTTRHFRGEHRNHGDRFDVPHFDYNEHLSKHLKFEQRIINKSLSDSDREKIMRQLAPDGDISKVDQELITKHLMRQARRRDGPNSTSSAGARPSHESNPYMYRGPQNTAAEHEGSMGLKAFTLATGAGILYALYSMLCG